jgi:hypothetical protein
MRHLRSEGALRASAWAELPAYRIADAATDVLLVALNHTKIEAGEGEPPPTYWQHRALMYLGVMTLREARAVLALLDSGYEAESTPHLRTITEAASRAQSVERDPSGTYARSWLEGKAGKPSTAFAKIDANDLWKVMSHQSHADHRAVENMYAATDDAGNHNLLVMPERRHEVSTGVASMVAGSCRDMARILGTAFGFKVADLAALDSAIQQLPLWQDDETAGQAESSASDTSQ